MSNQALLPTPQAAPYLGVSPGSLHRWRKHAKGPDYLRVGHKVFYRPSDLDRWLETCAHKTGDS